MKIQRFRARTSQEALELARIALGPEALILQTRRVPAAGIERLLNRPLVEVQAAVDAVSSPGPKNRAGNPSAPSAARPLRTEGRATATPAAWQSELAAIRSEIASLRGLLYEQAQYA